MNNNGTNIVPIPSQFIIAIGASAGGLQEINSFFDHTPLDGVSYVIIQHLSADYKSVMASLVTNHSKLQVLEATDNMVVEVNKVYVIPSTNYMTINNGRLLLTEKHKTGTPHLTINTFFNSLADDMGSKAIGVLLSGTGSDGSNGIETIKLEGGMVLVSDPSTAEYSEMPANAIKTGLVDYIVAPAKMPAIIEDYVKRKENLKENIKINENEEKIRKDIIDFINAHHTIDFSDYKPTTILRRIKRRAAIKTKDNLEAYFILLKEDETEVKALTQDFLISVTAFFRDKEAFEILESTVIPNIVNDKNNEDEIKIWVAGCATGEEAYSMAILFKEALDKANKTTDIKIFATDLDNKALSFAKIGFYENSISKNVSTERLNSFFTKQENGYKISEAVRKMLIFANHDLVKNPPYCNMDLISCRNLLIYLNQNLQKKLLAMLQFGLKKDGYLLLGPSENIVEQSPFIEEVNKKWKIYKMLEAQCNVNFDVFSPPVLSGNSVIPAELIKLKTGKKRNEGLNKVLNDALMHEMGNVGVCVDEDNRVVQSFGDTSKYLLPKMFNFDLIELLPKNLSLAYKNACRQVAKTNKKAEIKDISIPFNNGTTLVNITVIPFKDERNDLALKLVLFNDGSLDEAYKKEGQAFDEKLYASEHINNLEEELNQTRINLQNAYEKLDASNENMQSFNEELLSTNQEMQSTNEEMQSVNEELHSINAEYQSKIKELSELNDDLNNYFRSNENGQLFLSKKLALIKFSPSAVKHFNLLDTDLGRPITNISSNIMNLTLEADAKEVIEKGNTITKEVEAINGKWYQMKTMPYIREKNKSIDGAIITFNDITQLKLVQKELDATNKILTTINADLDNFVYTASHDLLGPLNNIEQIISMLDEHKAAFTPEINQYHALIQTSVVKFKSLIRDLAVVGKIESQVIDPVPINLLSLIDEIKLSIQSTITNANAQISTDLHVEDIRFSKKNLRSIIYNLINNAIKFRSADRRIKIVISTEIKDGFVLLSISDNGLGIAKEQIANIFTMYKRINPDIEGQGLGLYLIKKIVDASGGRVEAISEAGKGTTFHIYFKL